jgi:hypothetical protein
MKKSSSESLSEIFALAQARQNKAKGIGNLLIRSLKQMKTIHGSEFVGFDDSCAIKVKLLCSSFHNPDHVLIEIDGWVYKNGHPRKSQYPNDDKHSLQICINDTGRIELVLDKGPLNKDRETFDFDSYTPQEACAKILCLIKERSGIFTDYINGNLDMLKSSQKTVALKKQLD